MEADPDEEEDSSEELAVLDIVSDNRSDDATAPRRSKRIAGEEPGPGIPTKVRNAKQS
jgi:hypothetical protein